MLLIDVVASLRELPRGQKVTSERSLNDALGMVIAESVCSDIEVPPCDNSAMDGYALNTGCIRPDTLISLSDRIVAGDGVKKLERNTAARIFTGAPIPVGANAVVIQENCDIVEGALQINTEVRSGDNIRPAGQDIKKGQQVVPIGKRLTAVDIGLIASVGQAKVTVFEPLNVAILSTGDELVRAGDTLEEGQIYNSNLPMITALLKELNYKPIDMGPVPDDFDTTCEIIRQASMQADVIISSGGVSVGEEDYIKPAVESLGSLDLWKIQMKPGKPVALGRVGDAHFIGLPGNPVSSFTVFQLIAIPLLQSLQGETQPRDMVSFKLPALFSKKVTTREEYIRVKLAHDPKHGLSVERFSNLSSGVLTSLSWADGLVKQPIDEAIEIGQLVEFLPIRRALL